MAIASLVLGIVWVYGIGAILALVFGYMAKSQIDASGGTQQGRGMAIAGIVLGWIGIGVIDADPPDRNDRSKLRRVLVQTKLSVANRTGPPGRL